MSTNLTKLDLEKQRLEQNNRKLSLDLENAQSKVVQLNKTASCLHNEIGTLKKDLISKETIERDLRGEIRLLKASVEEEKRRREETLAKLVTENDVFKNRLRESETRHSQLEKKYKQAESKADEKLEILQRIGLELSQHAAMELSFKQQIYELTEETTSFRQTMDAVQRENARLQQRENDLVAEIETMRGSTQNEKLNHNTDVETNSEKKSDTETCDEVAGHIAESGDLSDTNRATRLCERFSNLFHEEWSDAVEELMKANFTQKEAICCLLSVVQNCLDCCKKAAKTQVQCLIHTLLNPIAIPSDSATNRTLDIQSSADVTEVVSQSNHALLQLRRVIATHPSVVQQIKEECAKEVKVSSAIESQFKRRRTTFESCTPYVIKCAELCWLICLLDPPLDLDFDFERGENINLEAYTLYSTSGQITDFLVWPPLYDSKSGDLVQKGVAEACTR